MYALMQSTIATGKTISLRNADSHPLDVAATAATTPEIRHNSGYNSSLGQSEITSLLQTESSFSKFHT
jgi:hypothetical protein